MNDRARLSSCGLAISLLAQFYLLITGGMGRARTPSSPGASWDLKILFRQAPLPSIELLGLS